MAENNINSQRNASQSPDQAEERRRSVSPSSEKRAASADNADRPSKDSTPAATESVHDEEEATQPPLPDEAPPLPNEALPGQVDDGWEPVWDAANQAYYFYNRFTQTTQWENPRTADSTTIGIVAAQAPGAHDRTAEGLSDNNTNAPGTTSSSHVTSISGGYYPAIHGDYDPTADYAIEAQQAAEEEREREAMAAAAASAAADPNATYEATGHFNRFTGRWQADSLNPDNYNDESKSRRQMHAFFDVDAAANSHDGRSLKAERSGKKLTKAELKAFQEKRRNKKEEKRRAWLRD